MKSKTVYTSTGKQIHIYDDVYDYNTRNKFYEFLANSLYSINGGDNDRLETKGEYNIYSKFTESDLHNMGFLSVPESAFILDQVKNMSIAQVRVNLSTLYDKNRFHVDTTSYASKEGITMLYYANMKWDIEAGGHTLFADDELENIEYCAVYKPGRVVMFDGSIPHCIMSPNIIAPAYRLSFAIQFIGDK